MLTAAHVVGSLCPAYRHGVPTSVYAGLGRAGGSIDEFVGQVIKSVPVEPELEIEIDACLISPAPHIVLSNVILEHPTPNRIREISEVPDDDLVVYKRGATQPSLTAGVLVIEETDLVVDVKVKPHSIETIEREYVDGYFIHSTDEFPFAKDGDSGSIVVDENGHPVGMVVAVSGKGKKPTDKAFCVPLQKILDSLDVRLG